MDGKSFGNMVAEKEHEKSGHEKDRKLTPEERRLHRVSAMKEFAEAHARHDHEGMSHALEAHDALLEEEPAEAPEAEEEEPGEE